MKILVCISTAEHAAKVVEFGCRLATESAAQVLLLHVKPNPWKHCKGYLEDVERKQIDEDLSCLPDDLEQFVAEPRRAMEDEGVAVNAVVIESDDPVDCILLLAEEEEVDLIVVGAAGRHFFMERLFQPSVAARLLKRSKRPVLVVPY